MSRPWEDLSQMISVDQARRAILDSVRRLDPVELPLLQSLGHVLATDVVAPASIPPFRNSAMDGYAVQAADVVSAARQHPVTLSIVGDLSAGYPPQRAIQSGEAIRIMTGAAVPDGADAVVRFEDTSEVETLDVRPRERSSSLQLEVEIYSPVDPWANVRAAGEDVASGETVLRAGTRVGPAEIGLLASMNLSSVSVVRRPRIGILSTGDEVIDIGPELQPGQIRNSNSYTLAALVEQAGGEPVMLGVARDTVEDISDKLELASRVDLLITSGGVSYGDFDLVKDVLQSEGSIDLWQVRIKPGKPMAFGTLRGTPLIGLPGNPVAAYVAFLQFALPAIGMMRGTGAVGLPTLTATLTDSHENRGQRRHYVRGVVERTSTGLEARPVGKQGSGVLTSLSEANCLIVLPEEWSEAAPGCTVTIELLNPDDYYHLQE